jgi:hypothetical protein
MKYPSLSSISKPVGVQSERAILPAFGERENPNIEAEICSS